MSAADLVFSTLGLLEKVAEYASAEDISNHSCVSRHFSHVFRQDRLWEQLCIKYGFKSLSSVTRTRGKKSFKNIYLAALCIECRCADDSYGSIVIDTNGGSRTRMGGIDGPTNSLVCICVKCFQAVQNCGQWNDRTRFALQRAKKRLSYHTWSTLLNKIPMKPGEGSGKKRKGSSSGTLSKKASERYEDPNHNNYLLKLLKK